MEVSFTKEYIEQTARAALEQWGYDCTVEIESQDILCVTVFSRNNVELDGQCRKFRFCSTSELTRSRSTGRYRKNYYEWHEALQKFASEAFWLIRGGEIRGAVDAVTKRRQAAYNAEHRHQISEVTRKHYEAHRGEILAHAKEYYASRHKEILAQKKYYNDTHREENKARCKAYHESHIDECRARDKAYRESHRQEIAVRMKAYYDSHREEELARKKAEREQLWTNGIETLKWSTLSGRMHRQGITKKDIIEQGWHPIE